MCLKTAEHCQNDFVTHYRTAPCKIRRSNSWSQMNEDYKFSDVRDPAAIEKEQHEKNMWYVCRVTFTSLWDNFIYFVKLIWE